MFLGGVSAGDVGDEERGGGLPPHRVPLLLHGHVPVSPGARGPGRPRPTAPGSIRRRAGGGASRRQPRRSGEHLGGDQRGDKQPSVICLNGWELCISLCSLLCINILCVAPST